MSETESGGNAHQAYQRALDQGRFMIQRCGGCGQAVFQPRELCPHCGHGTLAFVAPAGTGTVYATTTVRRKPAEGGDYNVALIDLDEGCRLMSRVEGLGPTEVRIGQRVKARVQVSKEGKGLVLFDPVTTQGGAA
jgi:uncharacterized OB-fold protein